MAEIWRAWDRLNREVIFDTADRDHILAEHDEMADRLHMIREAIEDPEFVNRDVQYRRRENYYRWLPTEERWLKVVVNFRPVPPQGTWAGEVITAYPVKRPKAREERLYP